MKTKIPQEELIELLLKKDERAWSYLYNNYYKILIHSSIKPYIQDSNVWDDIINETFFIIYNSMEKYNRNYSIFTWMKMITRYHTLDYIKTKNYKKEKNNVDFELCVDWLKQQHEHNKDLDNLFNDNFLNILKRKLNKREFIIIEGLFFKGLSTKELSKIDELLISQSRIRQIRDQAFIKIRRLYEKN